MANLEKISSVFIALLMLAVVYVWQSKLPMIYRLQSIQLPLEQGVAIAGAKEFVGAGIEDHHIRFTLQPNESGNKSNIALQNISYSHALKVKTEFGYTDAGYQVLKPGWNYLSINGEEININASKNSLAITHKNTAYTFKHGHIVDGPSCSQKDKWLNIFKQVMSQTLVIGGGITCGNKMALAGKVSVKLQQMDDAWVMSSLSSQSVFIRDEANQWASLSDTAITANEFVLGKSTYRVDLSAGNLLITPTRKIPLFQTKPDNVSMVVEPLIDNNLSLFWLFIVLVCSLLIFSQSWCVQLLVVISCFGFMNQFQLAMSVQVDSLYEGAISIMHRVILLLLSAKLFTWGFTKFTVRIPQGLIAVMVIAVMVFVILILQLLQIMAGNEIGLVGSLNPLELTKLLLALIMGGCLYRLSFFENSGLQKAIVWNVIFVALSSGFAVGVAYALSDYSTIAVVGGILLCYMVLLTNLLRQKHIVHFRVLGACIFGVLFLVNLFVIMLIKAIAEDISIDWFNLPSGDRFKTFFLPAQTGVDGLQQQKAAIALAAANYYPNLSVPYLNIPAIESDYAFTYLVSVAGKLVGAFFASAMVLLAVILIYQNQRNIRTLLNPLTTVAFNVRCTLLYGLFVCAFLNAALATHVFLTLGVNLQLIPAMGVPTMFVSVGQSHALLFVIPCIVWNVIVNNRVEKCSEVNH